MKFILEAIEEVLGLSPPNAAIAGVLVGMLMVVLGLLVITRLLTSLQNGEGDGDHHLMPTLAEEVLDADLVAIYRRSLRFDARLFNALYAWPEGAPLPKMPAGPPRVGETGSALGRALRKLLLSIQAQRFAQLAEHEPRAQKNKPPFEEACRVLMHQVLDEAFALDPSASDIDPVLHHLTVKLDQTRRALQRRADDEDSVDGPRIP